LEFFYWIFDDYWQFTHKHLFYQLQLKQKLFKENKVS